MIVMLSHKPHHRMKEQETNGVDGSAQGLLKVERESEREGKSGVGGEKAGDERHARKESVLRKEGT